ELPSLYENEDNQIRNEIEILYLFFVKQGIRGELSGRPGGSPPKKMINEVLPGRLKLSLIIVGSLKAICLRLKYREIIRLPLQIPLRQFCRCRNRWWLYMYPVP